MKRIILLFTLLFLAVSLFANSEILKRLQQIKEISNIQKVEFPLYSEFYEFLFEQPIDHEDLSKGTFTQRVQLGHKNYNAPVVAILEGYNIGNPYESELSEMFKTNQVIIEHRFFDKSKPEGGIPWEELTIKQAATDHHKIIEALKSKVYPDNKWITTGISKGGQTTVFHRYFFPEDADISVAYVAPINLEYVDPRLERYLSNLGDTPDHSKLFKKAGGKQTKWQITDFQLKCFKNFSKLVPIMEWYSSKNKLTFEKVGGMERALKLTILEFPFAFWQWGRDINTMPEIELNNYDDIFDYLVKVSPPSFFSDKEIEDIQAFYYAAMTEIGMYDYNLRTFKKYFKEEENNTIDFSFTMPEGYEETEFDREQMQAIDSWLRKDAKNMIFIYGALDPWSGTAANVDTNPNCKKYVKGDMHHGCRINSFEGLTKNNIIKTIEAWLEGRTFEDDLEILIY